jgi:hypothetical protein
LQLVKSIQNSSPKVFKIAKNDPSKVQTYHVDITSPGFGAGTFDEYSPSPSPLLGRADTYLIHNDGSVTNNNVGFQESLMLSDRETS